MVAVSEAIADAPSASEKLRRLFRALTEAGSELFSRIANCTTSPPSRRDKWPSTEQYAGHLQQLIGQILVEGRRRVSSSAKPRWMKRPGGLYGDVSFHQPGAVAIQSRHRAHRGGAACLLILRSLSPD